MVLGCATAMYSSFMNVVSLLSILLEICMVDLSSPRVSASVKVSGVSFYFLVRYKERFEFRLSLHVFQSMNKPELSRYRFYESEDV